MEPRREKYLGFSDLQVPHLDTTGREIGNFELDVDGPLRFSNASSTTHATSESTRHTTATLVIALD